MESKDLQEELTCPICLEYFEDPVSMECGHNFCRSCLRRSWAPGGGAFPCPECRQPSSRASLRPNRALARLTERTRRGPSGLCSRHWEPLRLFCEDDQLPVCLVCRESQEHQDHSMAPVDEAFERYLVSWPLGDCEYCPGKFPVYLTFSWKTHGEAPSAMGSKKLPLEAQRSFATPILEQKFKPGVGRDGARLITTAEFSSNWPWGSSSLRPTH